jgi:hypothetical protein
MNEYTAKASQRLWAKTKIEDDPNVCWEWQANKVHGYGRIRFHGKSIGAHRLSYLLNCEEIPDGLDVLHTCDNPGCVNPKHLFLGTHTQNMQDMIQKGRGNKARGENGGASKLTEIDVVTIRKRYAAGGISQRQLAKEYNITRNTLFCIVSNKTWNWL